MTDVPRDQDQRETDAERIARQLRDEPLPTDELRMARSERSLVDAWRAHGAARVSLPGSRLRRRPPRWTLAASVAASVAAGALLGLYGIDASVGSRTDAVASNTARFELRIGDAAVQSGKVAEGQTLESGKHGHIEVTVDGSRLDIARGSEVRLDRIASDELRVSVLSGTLDVNFHPLVKGEQRMTVETLSARVLVVGTHFSVAVDGRGNTAVQVTEGVVEVVPKAGGTAQRVTAGQRTYVEVDGGDEYEDAVRAAIEDNLELVAEAETEARELADGLPAAGNPEAFDDSDAMEPVQREEGVVRRIQRLTTADRLDGARRLLRQDKHTQARERLRQIANSPVAIRYRVEALTLIAESYTAQGYVPRATASYREAAQLAPGHPAGHNALFALARLMERNTLDKRAAAAAYRRYLNQAPSGALSAQAHQALCRLGDSTYCK